MGSQPSTFVLLAACLVSAGQPLPAQTGSSGRPLIVSDAGGFTARRLARPPIIDEKNWTSVDMISGDVSTAVVPPDLSYVLTFIDPGEDTGDFMRY